MNDPPMAQHRRSTLEAIGLTARSERTLRVDNYLDVVQAAEAGLGVAIAYRMRNRPVTSSDRLVALSPRPLPVPFAL